ncbi:hypothetical protein GCM10025787_36440 [Saccharopolyspora rosea]
MAYKLVHKTANQQIRFPNAGAAVQYAQEFGGGTAAWRVTVAGCGMAPGPSDDPASYWVPQGGSAVDSASPSRTNARTG